MPWRPAEGSATAIDKRVGKTLNMFRWSAKMTQDDLSKAAGISKRAVIKYEHGLVRISASRLYQFAKILSVEPGEFFKWIDQEPLVTHGAIKKADQQALELARLFREIGDPDIRSSIFEFARKAAGRRPQK